MLIIGHVGYTVGGAWAAQRAFLKQPIDLRLVAFMSLLPDLVDRALYAFVLPEAQGGRLIAHTLLFNLLLLAVLVAIRREFWIYGLASMGHLLLDGDGLGLHHALWPVLGADLANLGLTGGPGAVPSLEQIVERLVWETSNTYRTSGADAQLLDVGGLLTLLALATAGGLYRPLALWRFLREGTLGQGPIRQGYADPPEGDHG